jgi:hypothetical protein
VLALNGLDERKFIHLDFLDFAMAVINYDVNVYCLHAIHDGLDCKTFTDLAISTSERTINNAFFGTTSEAFETNLRCAVSSHPSSRPSPAWRVGSRPHPPSSRRYHYLMAFHLFLLEGGRTDLCVRTGENPKATRQFHPLTTFVMELPKRQGGLGMVKASLSYCKLTTSPHQSFHKPTNLWSDDASTLELFVDSDGACDAPRRESQPPCPVWGGS